MMELTSVLASLLLAVQTQPAAQAEAQPETEPATVETPAPAVEEEPEVDPDDEMICRKTSVIGSRFKKRICATREEWATLRKRSKENAGEMQRRGRGLDPNGS